MVHPRHRDGSGLRRTPALVALHHPPARRCRPLPSPNTASTLLSRPCRRPGDGYRVYPRLETSESVKLSELLELGFPPKKTRDVASADKTSKLRTLPSAASHSPRFRRFRTCAGAARARRPCTPISPPPTSLPSAGPSIRPTTPVAPSPTQITMTSATSAVNQGYSCSATARTAPLQPTPHASACKAHPPTNGCATRAAVLGSTATTASPRAPTCPNSEVAVKVGWDHSCAR